MKVQEILLKNVVAGENYRLDETSVAELMRSIKSVGLLEPVIVKKVRNRYHLMAGYRRYNACKKLGHKTIAAAIREGNESSDLINLTENLQREDTSSFEVGRGIHNLMESENINIEEASIRLGIPKNGVKQYLDLFKYIPVDYRNHVKKRTPKVKDGTYISNSTAAAIVNLKKCNHINASEARQLFSMAKKDTSFNRDKIRLIGDKIAETGSLKNALIEKDTTKFFNFRLSMNTKDYQKLLKKGEIKHQLVEALEVQLGIEINPT